MKKTKIYPHKQNKPRQNKNLTNPREGGQSGFSNSHTIIIFKCPVSDKNHEVCKEKEKYSHSYEKIKLRESTPEETITSNLLDRDFKTTGLNTPKGLIENMRKEMRESEDNI